MARLPTSLVFDIYTSPPPCQYMDFSDASALADLIVV